ATQRYGGLAVMGAGSVIAALASLFAFNAGGLDMVVLMQFVAGGAWGCVLMSAVTAALAIGHTGREGKVTGGLFSLLAAAALARIAIIAAQLDQTSQFHALLSWAPVVAWGLGGLVLFLLLPAQR